MRRKSRSKHSKEANVEINVLIYSVIGLIILATIVFSLLLYSKDLNKRVRAETLTEQQISSIFDLDENNVSSQSASTEIGKSVNEIKNSINESENKENQNKESNQINSIENKSGLASKQNNLEKNNQNVVKEESSNKDVIKTEKNAENKNESVENVKENQEKDEVKLNFQWPVEGDVIKNFAQDTLVYSQTLQEWTTHMGIDVKVDKKTIVKSAEAGFVKSIKNDPRYGLTIVIQHENGFQTIYSNLLTSEFVVEGEKVEKGQTLGTVGNTAVFEIADETHLHFEILKDSVQQDPMIYLN